MTPLQKRSVASRADAAGGLKEVRTPPYLLEQITTGVLKPPRLMGMVRGEHERQD